MSTPIITVDKLGKKYRLRHQVERQRYTALRDVITYRVRRLCSTPATKRSAAESNGCIPSTEDFWALKDVSFEVEQGEVVGIIGRNGAGKSTLLKILSRITEPTEGRVTLKGRVASLLEVGTGFHPELTGRENIFLNGAILGMARTEITRKFDEIAAFAGVEKFLDTPIKRYSSGMYVRLAFAVAAHLEPEILIVDEVLAVGDADFQKKCLGKMQEVGRDGRTVLFVSHQLGMVSALCRSGLLLQKGHIVEFGPVATVIDRYQRSIGTSGENDLRNVRAHESGQPLAIVGARTATVTGAPSSQFGDTEQIVLELDLASYAPVAGDLFITVALLDRLDRRVFTDEHALRPMFSARAGSSRRIRLDATVPMPLLVAGDYSFILTINSHEGQIFDRHAGVCRFSIIDRGSRLAKYEGRETGPIMPPLKWQIVKCDAMQSAGT